MAPPENPSQIRDYATAGASINIDTAAAAPTQVDLEAAPQTTAADGTRSPTSPADSVRFRKVARSNTARTYKPDRPGKWLPGAEPGIDVSAGPQSHDLPKLQAECDITVVDFSQGDMKPYHLENDTLGQFLQRPKPVWADCRWINVNGLSWDVIETLARDQNFHRLAIEDLTNPRNRTKADWYQDQVYIVLPLHKLIHSDHDSDSDHGEEGATSQHTSPHDKKPSAKRPWTRQRRSFWPIKPRRKVKPDNVLPEPKNYDFEGVIDAHMAPMTAASKIRTLQRYHGGPNEDRIMFFEKHSALSTRHLAVGVEQVSIFITSDNQIISFFESSAEDIEAPLIRRLGSSDTILRRCSDACMIMQAILDAIIDLAIPVVAAYQDAIGDLELNVLTEADVRHTTALYVLTSEVVQLRSNMSPIANLVKTLRDHKSEPIATPGLGGRPAKPSSLNVTISPMSVVYLGDVEDHTLLIIDGIDQMRRAADNMIDLIFNTNASRQNESIKQLTLVSIMFLPLTFLVGYFGQNFEDFPAIKHSDAYFWKIAVPVCVTIAIWLTYDSILYVVMRKFQRRGVMRTRKARRGRKGRSREW